MEERPFLLTGHGGAIEARPGMDGLLNSGRQRPPLELFGKTTAANGVSIVSASRLNHRWRHQHEYLTPVQSMDHQPTALCVTNHVNEYTRLTVVRGPR